MTVRHSPACKICRVRDVHTARLVAQLGAEFIGLHAIKRLKRKYAVPYQMLTSELRKYYPRIGVVLVTKTTSIKSILRMVSMVNVTHVQLHSPWTAARIYQLRWSDPHRLDSHQVEVRTHCVGWG